MWILVICYFNLIVLFILNSIIHLNSISKQSNSSLIVVIRYWHFVFRETIFGLTIHYITCYDPCTYGFNSRVKRAKIDMLMPSPCCDVSQVARQPRPHHHFCFLAMLLLTLPCRLFLHLCTIPWFHQLSRRWCWS